MVIFGEHVLRFVQKRVESLGSGFFWAFFLFGKFFSCFLAFFGMVWFWSMLMNLIVFDVVVS